MSYTACIFGTPFSLKEGVSPDVVRALVQEHMDDYCLDFDETADGKFVLDHPDTFEAGESLGTRLNQLAKALESLVADAFVLTLRDCDSPNDERDSEVFGGPDEPSILAFRQQRAIDAALESLRGVPGLDRQIDALRVSASAAPAEALAATNPQEPAFDLTQKLAVLEDEGFTVEEDPDQEGKWYWWHAESATGSDTSYDTQEEACKAALACLDDDKVTLMLHLDVNYKLNGHSPDAMVENLKTMVGWAIGEGLLTGYTGAEARDYNFRVDQVADLDEDELTAFMFDRVENGAFNLEGLPRRLARYGMMPPGDFISEMDERMQEMEFGRYAEDEQTSERPAP
jgi:hypothetical protein